MFEKLNKKENGLGENASNKDAVRNHRNVFEEVDLTGNDENFIPAITEDFSPTDALPGTPEKVRVLAERVRNGVPLWNPEDRTSYDVDWLRSRR